MKKIATRISNSPPPLKAMFGSPKQPLTIADYQIECYVLENGIRVITGRGMQKALGLGIAGGAFFKRFVGKPNLQPYISEELKRLLDNPIKFDLGETYGRLPIRYALGYEATVLPELCNAVLRARRADVLDEKQEQVANICEILLGGLATVGIIALVDEITGYQKQKNEYQKIIEKYVARELQNWIKTFGEDYYFHIYRLKGWNWNRYVLERKNHPRSVANITNRIVYEKLPNGVLEELKRLNPVDEKGNRRYKQFQFLTPNVGYVHLLKHLGHLVAIMERYSDGAWDEALYEIDKRFKSLRDPYTQLTFDFATDEERFNRAIVRASQPQT